MLQYPYLQSIALCDQVMVHFSTDLFNISRIVHLVYLYSATFVFQTLMKDTCKVNICKPTHKEIWRIQLICSKQGLRVGGDCRFPLIIVFIVCKPEKNVCTSLHNWLCKLDLFLFLLASWKIKKFLHFYFSFWAILTALPMCKACLDIGSELVFKRHP